MGNLVPYQPPFTLTPAILRLVAEIAEVGEMSRGEIQGALGLQDRKSFRVRYLTPALAEGLIEMILPEKPNSRLQKYRLTDQGRSWMQRRNSEPRPNFRRLLYGKALIWKR